MDYLISILTTIGIYAIMALSLNLLVGFSGLLSLAHVAFFGIGGYAVAICTATPEVLAPVAAWLPWAGWQPGFWSGLVLGLEVVTVVALPIGWVLNKFSGDVYCIATMGIAIIAYTFFLNVAPITQGPLGIAGVVPPTIGSWNFSRPLDYMSFVWVCLGLVALATLGIAESPFGRILRSVREDELTIRLFGYHTEFFKLMIFVISAWMAVLAGGLFACHLQFIDPSSFVMNEGIFVVTMVIMGGLASHRGAFLGAVIMVALPEALRFVGAPPEYAAQMRQIIYGLILVLLMIFRPQGVLGKYRL